MIKCKCNRMGIKHDGRIYHFKTLFSKKIEGVETNFVDVFKICNTKEHKEVKKNFILSAKNKKPTTEAVMFSNNAVFSDILKRLSDKTVNKTQKKILKCLKSYLSCQTVRIRNSRLGEIKGILHNNYNELEEPFISYLLNLLESLEISLDKIRDIVRMKEYKKNHPICEKCNNEPSEHTHHKISVSSGGKETEENYMALCKSCHAGYHPEIKHLIMSTPKGNIYG